MALSFNPSDRFQPEKKIVLFFQQFLSYIATSRFEGNRPADLNGFYHN